MTTKDSICIRCDNLAAYTNARFITGEVAHLCGDCYYGGKNAGNRKTCKKFVEASEEKIKNRMEALEW